MKKPNLIIGKKQIILSCLTLMLAIAVYVNYVLSDQSLADPSVSTNAPVVGQQAEEQSRRGSSRMLCCRRLFGT